MVTTSVRSFGKARSVASAVLCSLFVTACGGGEEVPPPYALPGDIDATFATDGIYVYPRERTDKWVGTHQVLVLSGDRVLALGGIGEPPSDSANFQSSASFALTGKGVLDGTFGQEGLLPAATTSAHGFVTARQLADGSLVLASKVLACERPIGCSVEDPGPTYRLQRFLSTGKLDATYALAGTHTTPSHLGNAAILTDGTTVSLGLTYATGFFFPSRPYSFHAVVVDAAGQANPALAEQFLAQMIRCSPSGTADLSSVWPKVAPVVRQTRDDRIIFAFGSCMLRLNRDATPDRAFGSDGLSSVDNAGLPVQQVLILEDGSILTFSVLADRKSYRVVRRLPNGSPDPAFGVGGVLAALALPFTLWDRSDTLPSGYVPNTGGFPALDRHGRFLVAGYTGTPGPSAGASYLARLDAAMNLDTSFGSTGTGFTTLRGAGLGAYFQPEAIAIDEVDRIVVGGRNITGNAAGPYPTNYAEAVTRLYGEPIVAEPVPLSRPRATEGSPFGTSRSSSP